jgi:hypothetical protein
MENPMEPKQPDQTSIDEKPTCLVRKALEAELLRTLEAFVEATQEQVKSLAAGEHISAQEMELQLELKYRENQRAFDALLRHLEEHGC